MDSIIEFAERHLGGRAVPSDLRKLLEWQRAAAPGSGRDFLKSAGVKMLDGDRMPTLIAAILTGRDNLDLATRLAHAQAMGEMLRCCGFVAEAAAGDAIGYWFSPDRIPIDAAPLCASTRRNIFPFCRAIPLRRAFCLSPPAATIRHSALSENSSTIRAWTFQPGQSAICGRVNARWIRRSHISGLFEPTPAIFQPYINARHG